MMDGELIGSFAERINEHDLVLHLYKNKNGKNKWSAICSAVDWIQTCIDGIDVSALEKTNTNSASIKFISFISCIDILWAHTKPGRERTAGRYR